METIISSAATRQASPPAADLLGRGVVMAMAVAAGLTVANIYYNQPMLERMHADVAGELVTYVPTATQIGYAIGLLFLVPLGDLVERRGLIVAQCLGLAVALAAVALAPTGALIVAASLLVGLMGAVAQQIIPLAANLAPPDKRGGIVGTVMAGLLCGILLSRTVAGVVAEHWGWRAMFWLAVPLALLTALLAALRLPRSAPERTGHSYMGLLRSLRGLWREFPQLRIATWIQSCQFAAFSVFWTVLSLRLEARFELGPQVAGLFGVLGVIGVLAAPIAGRVADAGGPRRVVAAASVVTLASWVVFSLWDSIAGLVVGVLLLDFAVQGSQVSNQSIIYALRPEARSRINTIYMTSMFVAGGLASAGATAAWHLYGWTGVSALGLAVSLAGLALQPLSLRFARRL